MKIDKEYAEAYCNLGNAYYHKDHYDRAIEEYNAALELSPGFAVVYNNRGNAYMDKGDLKYAIRDFNKARRLGMEDAELFYNRGITRLRQSEWENARADLAIAKDKGINIVEAFHVGHKSIAAFEKKAKVKLPEGITEMIASDAGKKPRAAAGGWVGLHDPETLKQMLYQARIDGSRESPVL